MGPSLDGGRGCDARSWVSSLTERLKREITLAEAEYSPSIDVLEDALAELQAIEGKRNEACADACGVWHACDPREYAPWTDRPIVIWNGADAFDGYTFVKHERWDVVLHRPRGNDLDADDAWPEGWWWTFPPGGGA